MARPLLSISLGLAAVAALSAASPAIGQVNRSPGGPTSELRGFPLTGARTMGPTDVPDRPLVRDRILGVLGGGGGGGSSNSSSSSMPDYSCDGFGYANAPYVCRQQGFYGPSGRYYGPSGSYYDPGDGYPNN